MQSHQGTDSFQRLTTRPEIELTLSNGQRTRNATSIILKEQLQVGIMAMTVQFLVVLPMNLLFITHAVANGNGRNLGIQSLPPNNYENMIIPVGINC